MQTVVIADDHALHRKAYRNYIESTGNYVVIAEATDGLQLLFTLQQLTALPNIAFIDLKMPIIDGIAAIDIINYLYPTIKCVGFSQYTQPNIIVDVLMAGAKGFLQKGFEEEIENLYNALQKEEIFVTSNQRNALQFYKECFKCSQVINPAIGTLTKKEILFLKLIANGLSYEDISKLLFISISTLNNHQANIKHKTGFADKQQQTLFAQQSGIAKSLRFNN
ncbi:MAG: response regulator transcription factor [Sphingobacteriia bacterium]|nr:response regulator transcription factor [Sphingobacteriia bacterium]